MRKILLILLITASASYAQYNSGSAFSEYHFGLLAGAGFMTDMRTGFAATLELRTNLSYRMSLKASIGISTVIENVGKIIPGYSYTLYRLYPYKTNYFEQDSYEYSIFPFSLGIEYMLLEEDIPVLILLETGYNQYSVAVNTNKTLGPYNNYKTYDEIPEEFKNVYPKIKSDASYRIGVGVGTRISISEKLFLDVRYLFNINTSLINCHQILAGISI